MVKADPLPQTRPPLQMQSIVKTFPGVRALDGVDLEALPGEVHPLLGQNGAGTSTPTKTLAGAHQSDSGCILIDGTPVAAPKVDAIWNHDDNQGIGVMAAIESVGCDEFFMVTADNVDQFLPTAFEY